MNDAVPTHGPGPVQIQLLHVPDCPLLDRVRRMLTESLQRAAIVAEVEELEGPYPSPTLAINGLDVTTGAPPRDDDTCCRLDLPTPAQIRDALDAIQTVT